MDQLAHRLRLSRISGFQIIERIGNLFSSFLIQNICCGYSKNRLKEMVLLSTQNTSSWNFTKELMGNDHQIKCSHNSFVNCHFITQFTYNMRAFKRALLFLLFPSFLICSYFFLKIPYYPYFFILKCHLRVKIQNFFPHSFHSLGFNNLSIFFFQGVRYKTSQIFIFYPKGLFPAYSVLNFLFLTTHCDQFCTWKSPTIPTFLHQ